MYIYIYIYEEHMVPPPEMPVRIPSLHASAIYIYTYIYIYIYIYREREIVHGASSRDAGKDPLLARQQLRGLDGRRAGDGQQLVGQVLGGVLEHLKQLGLGVGRDERVGKKRNRSHTQTHNKNNTTQHTTQQHHTRPHEEPPPRT